jgi:hypothetical protein
MAPHIPFITGQDACRLVARFYGDSEYVRIPVDKAKTFTSLLPTTIGLWVDSAADGLDDLTTRRSTVDRNNSWYDFMKSIPEFEDLGNPTFWAKPDSGIVKRFVTDLLAQCANCEPTWVTVPQLPVKDSSRNKINRALAKASGEWKSAKNSSIKLILPLIFTHQDQVNSKTERNRHVEQARRCYQEAKAEGIWVVDKSLDDDSGSKTLRNVRLPALVSLHQEINDAISSHIRIAGPYWGMNLLLWARGLVDYPAIGVGNGYQYFLAGGHAKQPSACLALPSLRRRSGVARLKPWLDATIATLGSSHPAAIEFSAIRKDLAILSASERAREQVAGFYKKWFNLLSVTPPAGRSLALFQDLSSAYALGRSLGELVDEGTARRPESVAEPLMLNCL